MCVRGGPPIRVERLALGLLTLLPFDGNSQLVERLDYLVFKNTLWDASVAVDLNGHTHLGSCILLL